MLTIWLRQAISYLSVRMLHAWRFDGTATVRKRTDAKNSVFN
jgi:hypothetical protein